MPKRKLVQKVLKDISKQLPKQRYQYVQKYKISMEEAKASGLEIPEGLEQEQEVMHKGPAMAQVNHLRRLKTAYKNGGKSEVYKYILPFLKEEKKYDTLKLIHSLPI